MKKCIFLIAYEGGESRALRSCGQRRNLNDAHIICSFVSLHDSLQGISGSKKIYDQHRIVQKKCCP